MSTSTCPRLYVHVSMRPCAQVSMRLCLRVSMFPCFHVSMTPCLNISISMSLCFHDSTSSCLHVLVHAAMSSSMLPCPRPCCHVYVHVAMSLSIFLCFCPCFHVLVHLHVLITEKIRLPPNSRNSLPWTPYCKPQSKLTENGNFHLFAANGKRKWETSVC
jgi:hypothetical protein